MKLSFVRWYDSASLQDKSWSSKEDVEELEPLHLYSIGWPIRETKDFLTIVPHWGEDQRYNFDGAISIPKKVIKSRIDFEISPKGSVKKVR